MIEGPGHVPMHKIVENVRLEEELCGVKPYRSRICRVGTKHLRAGTQRAVIGKEEITCHPPGNLRARQAVVPGIYRPVDSSGKTLIAA